MSLSAHERVTKIIYIHVQLSTQLGIQMYVYNVIEIDLYVHSVPVDDLSSDRAPGVAEIEPSQRPSSLWGHVGRSLLLPVHAKDDQRLELCHEVCW